MEERNVELNQALVDFYVITDDGKLYSNCRIDGMKKVCDEINVVTDEELQLNLKYWFSEYDKFDNYYTKEEIDEGFEDILNEFSNSKEEESK